MIAGRSVLALIPARAGSRRAPGKNLAAFKIGDRLNSLIGWTLEHAAASAYIDTTAIVSDDPACLRYATPPIIAIPEPAHLATAHARMEAVIVYALYASTTLGEAHLPLHDLFVLLQPTSPYRTAADIDACLELAIARNTSIVSRNPQRLLNGAVYVAHTLAFLSSLSLASGESYIMPTERSLDINHPDDFLTSA